MTHDRLRFIITVSVTKADLSPALRRRLAIRALQQVARRHPLAGVFVCLGTTALPRCLLLSRN